MCVTKLLYILDEFWIHHIKHISLKQKKMENESEHHLELVFSLASNVHHSFMMMTL